MQTVPGRESWVPRRVKGVLVSPRPWRRRRTCVGVGGVEEEGEGGDGGGGVMLSVREGSKSAFVGRRGIVLWAQ